MHCTYCNVDPMPEHLGMVFTMDGDPFCDRACKSSWDRRMANEINRLTGMTTEEFNAYMDVQMELDAPISASEDVSSVANINWKRDGF